MHIIFELLKGEERNVMAATQITIVYYLDIIFLSNIRGIINKSINYKLQFKKNIDNTVI